MEKPPFLLMFTNHPSFNLISPFPFFCENIFFWERQCTLNNISLRERKIIMINFNIILKLTQKFFSLQFQQNFITIKLSYLFQGKTCGSKRCSYPEFSHPSLFCFSFSHSQLLKKERSLTSKIQRKVLLSQMELMLM